jgi:heme-degrading monooxygenase HmoA
MNVALAGAARGGIASGLQPPYYAVIFTSLRSDGDNGYGEASDAMVALAAQQPGFLGIESARGSDGIGITVSYWQSEEAIAGWRRNADHSATRERGRSLWYQHYEVRVCRVERAYAGPPARA